jgi:hypothetical protein
MWFLRVLANMSMHIENLVLKFESADSVVALTVRTVEVYTNNPQFLAHEAGHRFMEIEGPDYSIFKIGHLRDITMCVDSKIPSGGEGKDHVRIFEPPVFSKFSLMTKARFCFASVGPQVGKPDGASSNYSKGAPSQESTSKNDSEKDATLRSMFRRGCLKDPQWVESRISKLQQVEHIMQCVVDQDNTLCLEKVGPSITVESFQTPSRKHDSGPLKNVHQMATSQVTFVATEIDSLTLSLSYAQIRHLQKLMSHFLDDVEEDGAAISTPPPPLDKGEANASVSISSPSPNQADQLTASNEFIDMRCLDDHGSASLQTTPLSPAEGAEALCALLQTAALLPCLAVCFRMLCFAILLF